MIRLNGYLHRELLAAIIGRWLVNRPLPTDARTLKQIVNFNGYAGCVILDAFAHTLFSAIHAGPIASSAVSTKGALKDALIQSPAGIVTPCAADLIARYRRNPDDYFRETPFNGRVYRAGDDAGPYLGSARVKRFHRIAEKTSRYLIDRLLQEVRTRADALADERAARLGTSRDRLDTPIDEQRAEFVRAERRVLESLRDGVLVGEASDFDVNDVLGVKLVVDGETEMSRVVDHLAGGQRSAIVERQVHAGNYNATSLIVRYHWPRDLVLDRPPTAPAMTILRERGCRFDVEAAFRTFIEDAEDDVSIEVIVSTYEEMLESEIGRSMHEEWVLLQRERREYRSSLARNVESLVDFMFRFCLARVEDVSEVPIRVWVRYLPDYVEQIRLRLAGVPSEMDFTHACACGEQLGKQPDGT